MHLFIKNYLELKSIDTKTWGEYLSKDNLLESVILQLRNKMNKKVYTEKLNEEIIDQALLHGHEDANLFLFFITISIICLTQHQQFEKAKSLVSIGENSINPSISPIVHAIFLQSHSRLLFFFGELKEEKRLMEKALKLINRDSPRYETLFSNYAYLLARSGMLNDLDKEDQKILSENLESKEDKGSLIFEILVANSIMQGDFEKGFLYLKSYQKAINFNNSTRYQNAVFSLNILSGNRVLASYKAEDFKEFAIIFEDFYESRWPIIANKIKVIKEIEWHHPFVYFITRYLPLHYELSNKNVGMARFLLQENQKLGKSHFLDDLFYSRIALLENRKSEALMYFKRLMDNVKKFGFMPRLEFELQFAKEILPSELFFLLQKSPEYMDKTNVLEENLVAPLEDSVNGLDLIVGKSNVLAKVKKLIQKFASITEPILVSGETGTGKELVAKALHDMGINNKEPFLAINCGALTDALLQSELFGYEAGAFTGAQKEKKGIFESAGRGTVFLDEFEDVSPKMQSSLLRVLESKEIRLIGGTKSRKIFCKIVIATNVSLKSLVAKKIFREDLYFRLAKFEIKLPALRARKEDIPVLIQHFLMNQKQSGFSPILSTELLDKILEYDWPGNIRELRNAIERMKILHSDKNSFGVNEFDFDQLEEFVEIEKSTDRNLNKENLKPESISTNKESLNEVERIEKIIANGFKMESRLQYLHELFIKYKRLSRSQVREILKVNPITAANALKALSEQGLIIKKTPTKSSKSHYYELKG